MRCGSCGLVGLASGDTGGMGGFVDYTMREKGKVKAFYELAARGRVEAGSVKVVERQEDEVVEKRKVVVPRVQGPRGMRGA